MTKPIDEVLERILAILKDHGVQRYHLMLDDPDSNLTVMRRGGGITWTRGALELELDATQIEWRRRIEDNLEEEEAENDG